MSKIRPAKRIQQEILRTLIILVTIMTALVTAVSIYINIRSESDYFDRNLLNTATVIADSEDVRSGGEKARTYLESTKASLSDVDVISVVGTDNVRIFHTTSELIGTVYDGTMPDFSAGDHYTASDTGPSGSQRRAYAAIRNENGDYSGFVLAVMLDRNINKIIMNTVLIHLLCAAAVIICAVIMSKHLSRKIKKLLRGYEPDIFSAMFSVRDNILESLDEGILAVGQDGKIIYMNNAAAGMLNLLPENAEKKKAVDLIPDLPVNGTLTSGEKITGIAVRSVMNSDILADIVPVMEKEKIVGALCILRDRTEYTKIMEDLSGVKYMVESMRANNHDFVNKLHVILGLIHMGKTDEACEYISNITAIQQTVIHNIMKNIEDPSVAALLIGKYARAAELDIKFSLKNGSKLSRSDISLPSNDLVTIIGNLLDNAMDSMNATDSAVKELSVGIFTQPHAMLISTDDTGSGITEENLRHIFENGYSTKGENRGTGLYVVNNLIKKYGGEITVDSEPDVGTSFTVTMTDAGGTPNV